MTPNEITTLIASNLNEQFNEPFKMMMMDRVNYWRSRLVKNSVDKDQKERKFFRQVIYIPMQSRDEVVCKVPYIQCKIAITTVKVPKPLRANGILFDYVGSINGMTSFQEGSAGMIHYMMKGKYSKKALRYTYENEYLKIYGNPDIPMIRIDGIFDDPNKASALNCLTAEDACDFWNTDYPITGDILQLVVQSILQIDYNRVSTVDASKEIPVVTPT